VEDTGHVRALIVLMPILHATSLIDTGKGTNAGLYAKCCEAEDLGEIAATDEEREREVWSGTGVH
jgi:hypothetical protein